MKHLALLLLPLTFISFSHAAPIIADAPVDHLYVPRGFDDNDNVEVIVTGKFISTCYSRNKVDVKVAEKIIDVHVSSMMASGEHNKCETMDVPFTENVTIGNLDAGTYTITVNGKLKEEIKVTEADSGVVDDHIYAPVDYVELGFTGGANGDAMLVGRSLDDCLQFAKVEYITNGKDTLSILPIMRKIPSVTCSGKSTYLEIPVKFDVTKFEEGKILLFVRTMDGKSVSTLVNKN
jgi:hypothetical protein